MNFDTVKKNRAYKQFLRDVTNAKVSHAYIINGEDGEMRRAVFKLACMSMLCKTACGECVVCQNILNGNYVEITELDANEKLSVRDIEALTEKANVKPVIGGKKIFFIDNAEKLSPQAQNKLLKTYEEPPEYLTFFLGAGQENGLLTTIRSRGKKLYLEDVSAEDIANELIGEGIDGDSAAVAATFALGNYSKALKFCQESGYRELYESVFNMFLTLKKSSQIPEYVYSDMFKKENILLTFDFMEIILCDVMKTVTGSSAPMFTLHREYDINKIAESFSAESVSESINLVNEGRKQQNANLNAISVAGTLLFGILEAKYKWQKR